MGRAEVSGIACGLLGGKADDVLLERLMAETQGNALFVVETLRMLASSGRLRFESGRWRLTGRGESEIPPTVKDVVLRRVETLPAELRRVLEFAAVEGVSLDPKVLGSSMRAEELTLLDRLEELSRRYQFIAPAYGGYQFGHELVRRVLYSDIAPARRNEIHRLIAEAMEMTAGPVSYGDLALHCCHAKMNAKCFHYSLLAGEDCLAKCAWLEALPNLERAASLCDEVGEGNDVRFRVIEGLGEANKELGNAPRALEYYQTLLGLGPVGNNRARIMRKIADMWTFGSGSLQTSKDEVLKMLDEAENIEGLEERERMEIAFSRATILQSVGGAEDAERHYAEAIELANRIGAKDRIGLLLSSYAFAFLSQGEVPEALEKLEEARRAYEADPYPSAEVEMLTCLGEANLYAGRVEEAMRFFDQCIRSSDALGFYHNSRWSHFYRALVFSELGELDSADSEAHECLQVDLKTDTPFTRLVSNTIIAHLMVLKGECSAAETVCLENQELLDKFATEIRTPVVGLALAVQAELLEARGKCAAGDAQFESAIRHLGGVWGGVYFGALVREWYSASLASRGLLDRAGEVAREAIVTHISLGNVVRAARLNRMVSAGPD
ncbi:MAG: hypothetical protein LUO79_02425 [Methanomassiliicoccales archaeon]|nr:hypothetical protein [Methanomassiliicoccales archaeon]